MRERKKNRQKSERGEKDERRTKEGGKKRDRESIEEERRWRE